MLAIEKELSSPDISTPKTLMSEIFSKVQETILTSNPVSSWSGFQHKGPAKTVETKTAAFVNILGHLKTIPWRKYQFPTETTNLVGYDGNFRRLFAKISADLVNLNIIGKEFETMPSLDSFSLSFKPKTKVELYFPGYKLTYTNSNGVEKPSL